MLGCSGNTLALILFVVTFVLQFVHRAIGGVCDKEGLHYEDFAKLLSLSEYSKLRHSLTAAIRQLARAGVKRQEVGGGRGNLLQVATSFISH